MRKPMYFVEPNALNSTGLAIGQDHGFADKLSLGLLEFAEDHARAFLCGWHNGRSRNRRGGLSSKDAEVVISTRQSYVGGTRLPMGSCKLTKEGAIRVEWSPSRQ
jgi:hypothetical protein